MNEIRYYYPEKCNQDNSETVSNISTIHIYSFVRDSMSEYENREQEGSHDNKNISDENVLIHVMRDNMVNYST